MDQDDCRQITDSLRHAITDPDRSTVRQKVADFGWYELLADERQVAVSTLFTLQGEVLSDTSFLDDVLLVAVGQEVPQDCRVVLPPANTVVPAARCTTDGLLVEGLVHRPDSDLVVPSIDAAGRLVVVRTAGQRLVDRLAPETIDPNSGWMSVRYETPQFEVVLEGAGAVEGWDRLTTVGRLALSHELIGIGRAMLDMTVEHVKTREQFGRPLAGFQAVKHKLADVRLWQECAVLAATAAWDQPCPDSAALAKAAACRFASTARLHCQQLLGGMGFTWEHPFHHYLRRSLTLEPLLGGADAQHRQLGAELRAGGIPDAFAVL